MSQSGSLGSGFVPPSVPLSFVTNSGTAVPAANVLNDLGAGSIQSSGAGNTVTTQLTGLTQYNIQSGGATSNTLNNIVPSATSGVPLISQGAAAQPVFGTAVVAGGGTGQTSLTAHTILVGNGTSPVTQITNGTTGQVLTAVTGADPVWSAATGPAQPFNVQTFTSNGTYTPTSGMKYCLIHLVGGGGSGGGAASTGVGGFSGGGSGGGGGGGYGLFTAAQIGASKAVTVGAGGAASANSTSPGNDGATSSVGVLITGTGGKAGGAGGANNAGTGGTGALGAGGTSTGTNVLKMDGQSAQGGASNTVVVLQWMGASGGSYLGMGIPMRVGGSGQYDNGFVGTGFGCGSTGAFQGSSAAGQPSIKAADGIVIIWEYI